MKVYCAVECSLFSVLMLLKIHTLNTHTHTHKASLTQRVLIISYICMRTRVVDFQLIE